MHPEPAPSRQHLCRAETGSGGKSEFQITSARVGQDVGGCRQEAALASSPPCPPAMHDECPPCKHGAASVSDHRGLL